MARALFAFAESLLPRVGTAHVLHHFGVVGGEIYLSAHGVRVCNMCLIPVRQWRVLSTGVKRSSLTRCVFHLEAVLEKVPRFGSVPYSRNKLIFICLHGIRGIHNKKKLN